MVFEKLTSIENIIILPSHFLYEYDSIIIDPPYNERYMKIYAKNQEQKSDFVIFADTRRTTLLFDWIRKIKPQQIIMKSFQFYRFAGYNVKGFITYAGGYRKPIFLLNNFIEIKK